MGNCTTIDPKLLEKLDWPDPTLGGAVPDRQDEARADSPRNNAAKGHGSNGQVYNTQTDQSTITSFARSLHALDGNPFPNWPQCDESPWDPIGTTRNVPKELGQILDITDLPLQSATTFEDATDRQCRSGGFGRGLGSSPWINDATGTLAHDYGVLDEVASWCDDNHLPLEQQVETAQSIEEFANNVYISEEIQDLTSSHVISAPSVNQQSLSARGFDPQQALSFNVHHNSPFRVSSATDIGTEQLANDGGDSNIMEQDSSMMAWSGYPPQLQRCRPSTGLIDGFPNAVRLLNFRGPCPGNINHPDDAIHQAADEQQVMATFDAVTQDFSHDLGTTLDLQHGSFPSFLSPGSDVIAARSCLQCGHETFSSDCQPASAVLSSKLLLTASTNATLPIVCESGQGGPAKVPPPLKPPGRRCGPLPKIKAEAITKNRKARAVCIRCRLTRVSCTGGIPCDRCSANSKAKIWDQPCIRAYFLEIVQGGTCNYISQRSINHLTLDGRRRVTMVLPEAFELNDLLTSLRDRKDKFNIRARYRDGPLYILDLGKCYSFLARLGKTISMQTGSSLRNFIDHLLLSVNVSGWQDCVEDCTSTTDVLAVLLRWNTQPSRTSFDMVLLDGTSAVIPLDIENPAHETEIRIAAQLARIICRLVEVRAYKKVQKVLNDQRSLTVPDQSKNFLVHLGRILLMMRWQISWRKVMLGDQNKEDNMSSQLKTSKIEIPTCFIYRMDELVKVLYFYFCNARRKLPSFVSTTTLDGAWSTYADAEPIFDKFPSSNTIEGFESWMKAGKDVIRTTTNSQTQSVH